MDARADQMLTRIGDFSFQYKIFLQSIPYSFKLNNGLIIPREKLKTLFDKFTRVDDSTTRTTRGTGLGLFIVKGLVEGMGGEIRLYSNEECGFCVKVFMPVSQMESGRMKVEN